MLKFERLSKDARRSFEEDGFLVVRGALEANFVDALNAAAERLATDFLHKAPVQNKPWYNDLDLRPGLLREEAFYQLASHSTVSLIVQLLGPNIQLHSTTLICRRPESSDLPPFRRGWHRDMRVAPDLGHEQLPRVGIKVLYCLTDFKPPDSGLTQMARGTHLLPAPLTIPAGGIDPADFEVCDLDLAAGDALLFENRIFHTATPNRSGRISKKIIYGYAYRWMRPEIYHESLDRAYRRGVDPVTRQLLGANPDIDAPPWALREWARLHGVEPPPVPWMVSG